MNVDEERGREKAYEEEMKLGEKVCIFATQIVLK